MKPQGKLIKEIEKKSVASAYGIEQGDTLLSINGTEIQDIFDYRYLIQDEELTLDFYTKQGETISIEIVKAYGEDLGIVFENGLMDEYRSCCNQCIFCFIDQMPPGMRETLYFKDDDTRLSFLQGNYVTLTNLTEKDIDRIIRYRLEPMNISFQTMNPKLRCEMLNNRFAGEALKKAERLRDAGITMNGQIVLCKGVNDGDELEYSIEKMTEYIPYLQSVSVVPVGLTKYRENLYPLEPFTQEDAKKVLQLIHKWQIICYEKYDTHFIHAGDEWYLLAKEAFPEAETYDGYLQLENGVGMMRSFMDEFDETMDAVCDRNKKNPLFHMKMNRKREVSVATGVLAYPMIASSAKRIEEMFPNITIHVHATINHFFGEKITVAGLITGQDLVQQLQGQNLGECLYLPECMLRYDEDVFLDDMTIKEAESSLQVKTDIVKSSGQGFVYSLLKL